MDNKKLMALARKNAAKSVERAKPRPAFDKTLDATRTPVSEEELLEANKIFKEMKKREF
jgi:hypothetical protein